MEFKDRLRELRTEKKLTQEQLCVDVEAATGFPLSQQRVTHWEKGQHQPDFETACKLADFFDVSLDYLLGHGNIRTPMAEYDHYNLNPTEKAIIDTVRSFPTEYGEAVKKLLEVTRGIV